MVPPPFLTVTLSIQSGKIGRHFLLKEALPIDSVWVALHGQWPVPQVRERSGRDATIVLDQIALGDSVSGEQYFRRGRDFHVVAANPNNVFTRSGPTAHAQPPSRSYRTAAPKPADAPAFLQASTR